MGLGGRGLTNNRLSAVGTRTGILFLVLAALAKCQLSSQLVMTINRAAVDHSLKSYSFINYMTWRGGLLVRRKQITSLEITFCLPKSLSLLTESFAVRYVQTLNCNWLLCSPLPNTDCLQLLVEHSWSKPTKTPMPVSKLVVSHPLNCSINQKRYLDTSMPVMPVYKSFVSPQSFDRHGDSGGPNQSRVTTSMTVSSVISFHF